jgi:hypothetical protein
VCPLEYELVGGYFKGSTTSVSNVPSTKAEPFKTSLFTSLEILATGDKNSINIRWLLTFETEGEKPATQQTRFAAAIIGKRGQKCRIIACWCRSRQALLV